MPEILDFFEPIEKIKRKEREGWKLAKLKPVIETIGSHSFGAALLGWLLAKKEKLNEEKVVKLLLVHDLVMAYMQDVTPRDKNYEIKNEIENGRIAKLLEKIPKEMKKEAEALITEYQKQETQESLLAREADKLDTLLQSLFYSKENGKKEIFREFFGHYKKFFRSKSGKKIIKQLESETDNEPL